MPAFEIAPVLQDVRATDGSFLALWRVLGRHDVLRRLGDAGRLEEAGRVLEHLGFHLDEGGLFLSLIAGVALPIPILDAVSASPWVASWRERLVSGESVLAVAITEPGAGSDALSMATSLRREAGRLVLRGEKWNITNAPVADAIVVFCRNETGDRPFLTALLVPTDAPGVRMGRELDLVAVRNSPTAGFQLDGVEVDPCWILGAPEEGERLLDAAFLRERLLAPFPLLGRMGRALQEGIDWAVSRRQFGRAIGEFQYVQHKLVDGYERLEAARLLAEEAVRRAAAAAPAWAHASMAKAAAAEAGAVVFKAMIELRGSYGVQRGAGLGEALLDSICASIAGGTREMQRKVVWDQLVLDRGRSRRTGRTRLFRHAAPPRRNEEGGRGRA